ncbi:hypothetical protein ACSBR1_019063 [Camellia fascicularis]
MAETIAIVGAVSGAVGAAVGVVQSASQAKPIFWDPPMDKVEEIHDTLNAAIHALGSIRKDFMNEVERNKMKVPSETYMEWINRAVEIEKQRRGPDINKFETLRKPLEQILDLPEKDNVKRIRIHGTVGIGKTTIMLNLNNHEQVAKKFNIFIWLTVSKKGSKRNLSREHLQQAIVQRMEIKMEGASNADKVA